MVIKTAQEYHLELARRGKAKRLVKNITQVELAKKSGVNVNTIRHLESAGDCSIDTLLRVLQSLQALDDFDHVLKQDDTIDIINLNPAKLRKWARKGEQETMRVIAKIWKAVGDIVRRITHSTALAGLQEELF